MISEGIATYFGWKTTGDTLSRYLNHESLEDYIKIYGEEAYYEIGFSLVKPILDRNIDKGIECLITNPPTSKDLEDIMAYQQKILGMLDGELK